MKIYQENIEKEKNMLLVESLKESIKYYEQVKKKRESYESIISKV